MSTGFEIIPAIDILNGKCVRLTQGNYKMAEEFSSNPIEIAEKWKDCGATRIHVVDLDGAKTGLPVNKDVISKILKSTQTKLQIGGGIRSLDLVKEYLEMGASYVILGTKAFQDKSFLNEALTLFNEKIIVSLDLNKGRAAIGGWNEVVEIDIKKLSFEFSKVKQIIFTDTTCDGTMQGPNISYVKEIARLFKSNVIVSGGISSLDDIKSIIDTKNQGYQNISGVIIGKSIYKGVIDLRQAIKLTKGSNKEG